jgi:hypothetical protein
MMRPVMVAAVDPWASVEEPIVGQAPLVLYPNPANDRVRLALPAGIPPGTRAEVVDGTGRIVLQSPLYTDAELATGTLAPGLYVVRVNDASGSTLAQGRLVVQH